MAVKVKVKAAVKRMRKVSVGIKNNQIYVHSV